MSYYKLKHNCYCQTVAITSNEKFLLPFDSVYTKKYTKNVLQYPGHEEDNTLNKNLKPNLIDNLRSQNHINPKELSKCKSCGYN
jgi:hypothetical protein